MATTKSRILHPSPSYRVGSANFSRWKIWHAHDNSVDSENVAGAREQNVHVHSFFVLKTVREIRPFFVSIQDQNTAETSQPQAQPTDN